MSGRRWSSLLVFMLVSALVVPLVRASPLLDFGFEGFSVTQFDGDGVTHISTGDYVLLGSFVLALPEERYLSGVAARIEITTIDNDGDGWFGGTEYVRVEVDGVNYTMSNALPSSQKTTTVVRSFPLTGHKGTQFTIKVYVRAALSDSGDEVQFELKNLYTYVFSEDYGIKSKLTGLKYIPPGAEGTPAGFLVNHTKLFLGETYTLSEGAVAFWIKWDGTTGIELAQGIGVDSNGYLYITNTDGTKYALEASLPRGVYVPVYIGWKFGEGYIQVNSTRVTLNWQGEYEIGYIGSYGAESSTLIDEFRLWDEYISADDIVTESARDQYELVVNNTSFSINPEGGLGLGTLYVTFMNENWSPLNTTILSKASQSAIAPDGTNIISIQLGNAVRVYNLSNLSATPLSFPSTDISSLTVVTVMVPSGYNNLEIWTLDGHLAYRGYVDHAITFTAVTGMYYRFVASSANGTEISVIRQINTNTMSIDLPVVNPAVEFNDNVERLVVEAVNDSLALVMYTSPEKTNITVTFTVFSSNGTPISNYTVQYSGVDTKQWALSLPEEFGYAQVSVRSSDGFNATQVITGKLQSQSWFSESLAPAGFLIILLGVVGTFAVTREHASYAPLTVLTLFTITQYVGLVSIPLDLYGVLVFLSVIGVYTSKEG